MKLLCPECGAQSSSLPALGKHKRDVHDDQIFKCQEFDLEVEGIRQTLIFRRVGSQLSGTTAGGQDLVLPQNFE